MVKQSHNPPMTGSLNPTYIFMVMTGGWFIYFIYGIVLPTLVLAYLHIKVLLLQSLALPVPKFCIYHHPKICSTRPSCNPTRCKIEQETTKMDND